MKLPNGYGSISKLGKNRRCPYAVRVTIGWDIDGKQIKKLLGYVKTYADGLKLLADYHDEPYNIDYKNITFEYIWNNNVVKKLEQLVESKKMSFSNLKGLKSHYKNHCKLLYKKKVTDIKYKMMQDIIDNCGLSESGKKYIRTVCVKTFNCAIDEYELPLKENPATRLTVEVDEKSEIHIPLDESELELLWKKYDLNSNSIMNHIIMLYLIMCYTGLRPEELFTIERDNVFLDENYMKGGCKTIAGKNRPIPIHPRIKPLIEYFYNLDDNKYPFRLRIENFNYGKFYRRFNDVMEKIGLKNHKPYDARHTFSTRMKRVKADQYILKRIMGHSIKDITEEVYTHRTIEDLLNEVKKII